MRARSTVAALAAGLIALAVAPGADAAIPYAPCEPAGFQCGQLAVPLDRTGAVPGTVTLSVKRVVASSNPTASAVVALAGGPGQAALPARPSSRRSSPPPSPRATCSSSTSAAPAARAACTCPAFERGIAVDRHGRAGVREPARPGARLLPHVGLGRRHRGAARRGRLPEARALRRLLRHEGRARLRRQVPGQRRGARARLGRHARGPDVLNVSTFKAMPRVLGGLCVNGACNGITSNVGRDLGNLVHSGRARPIRGEGRHPRRARLKRDPRPGRPARHPARRRPQPDAARGAAGRRAQRLTATPTAPAPAAAGRGPDRDPGRPRAGLADDVRLRCALRGHALRGVGLPVGPRGRPRAARRPGRGGRPRAPDHRLRAVRPQGRAAQRGDPAVRRLAQREPGPGGARRRCRRCRR